MTINENLMNNLLKLNSKELRKLYKQNEQINNNTMCNHIAYALHMKLVCQMFAIN